MVYNRLEGNAGYYRNTWHGHLLEREFQEHARPSIGANPEANTAPNSHNGTAR
jgi:hypothetical protein